MALPPSLPVGKAAIFATLAWFTVLPGGHAQDFTRQVAGADRLFDDGVVPDSVLSVLTPDPTFDGLIKGEVSYAASATLTYDSNINLSGTSGSPGAAGAAGIAMGKEDSVILSLNPTIFYTTDPEGGARNLITLYYSPSYLIYFNDSSLGGLNHSGGLSFQTSGARTTVSTFFNLAQNSGADRLSGGYSEATVMSGGLRVEYQLAPRTTVFLSGSASVLDYSDSAPTPAVPAGGPVGAPAGAAQEGSETFTVELGGFWAATERLSLGPSVRYNRNSSENTGHQTALGLLFNAKYEATEKTRFSGSLGVESVENSRQSGGEDISLTGGLSFSYLINELWSWTGGISYARIPSSTSGGYMVNDLRFQTGLQRTLTYGFLSAGLAYSITSNDQVGPAGTSPGDDNYFSFDLSYWRPVFRERARFQVGFGYSQTDGSQSWDRWTLSTGLSASF